MKLHAQRYGGEQEVHADRGRIGFPDGMRCYKVEVPGATGSGHAWSEGERVVKYIDSLPMYMLVTTASPEFMKDCAKMLNHTIVFQSTSTEDCRYLMKVPSNEQRDEAARIMEKTIIESYKQAGFECYATAFIPKAKLLRASWETQLL